MCMSQSSAKCKSAALRFAPTAEEVVLSDHNVQLVSDYTKLCRLVLLEPCQAIIIVPKRDKAVCQQGMVAHQLKATSVMGNDEGHT